MDSCDLDRLLVGSETIYSRWAPRLKNRFSFYAGDI